jgi:hypothetical protein
LTVPGERTVIVNVWGWILAWRRAWVSPALALWLALSIGGLALLAWHASVPGSAASPPATWPDDLGIDNELLGRDPTRPLLLLFAHPHCPCTRATLGELEKIAARRPGAFRATVAFYTPPDKDDAWARTDLWKTAAAIPNTRTIVDRGGRLAQRFQSSTSGQVLLYDARGELAFQGGITSSRGHAGENQGRHAVEVVLSGERPDTRLTPVFGCPILTSTTWDEELP